MTKLRVQYNGKSYTIQVDLSNCTVRQFKERLCVLTGVPVEQQKVFGWPRRLAGTSTVLSRLGLVNDQQLLLYKVRSTLVEPNLGDNEVVHEVVEEKKMGNENVVDFWDDLPGEIQYLVFGLLDTHSLLNCALVSRNWNEFAVDNWVWQDKYHLSWPSIIETELPETSENIVTWRSLYFEHHWLQRNWATKNMTVSRLNDRFIKCMDFRPDGYLKLEQNDTFIGAENVGNIPRLNQAALHLNQIFSSKYETEHKDSIVAYVLERSKKIMIGNVWKKEIKKELMGHDDEVSSVAFIGSHHLVSADVSGTLCLWDLYRASASLPWSKASSELVGKKKLWRSDTGRLSFNQHHLIAGSADGTITVLDIDRTLYPALTIRHAHADKITCIAQNRNGSDQTSDKSDPTGNSPYLFATCGLDPFVHLWDNRSGKLVNSIYGDQEGVGAAQFGWENQLITAGTNGSRFFDLRTMQLLLQANESTTNALYYDGSRFLLATTTGVKMAHLGTMGVPPSVEQDSILTSGKPHAPINVHPTLDLLKIPIAQVGQMHVAPSYMVAWSSTEGIVGFDFSARPKRALQVAQLADGDEDDF